LFIFLERPFCQGVEIRRRICIVVRIEIAERIDDFAWALGSGGCIEIDEGLAIDGLVECREVRGYGSWLFRRLRFAGDGQMCQEAGAASEPHTEYFTASCMCVIHITKF